MFYDDKLKILRSSFGPRIDSTIGYGCDISGYVALLLKRAICFPGNKIVENGEPFREFAGTCQRGGEFDMYGGRESDSQTPVLAAAVAAELPSPQSLRQLKHEYALASELASALVADRYS